MSVEMACRIVLCGGPWPYSRLASPCCPVVHQLTRGFAVQAHPAAQHVSASSLPVLLLLNKAGAVLDTFKSRDRSVAALRQWAERFAAMDAAGLKAAAAEMTAAAEAVR